MQMTTGQIYAEAVVAWLSRGATVQEALEVFGPHLAHADNGSLGLFIEAGDCPEDVYEVFLHPEAGWTYSPGSAQAHEQFVLPEVAP